MGRYDAIIIGAGVGGLLTGNYLARKGLKTVILEQRAQPGGLVSGFRRQGFYFDGGDQSFNSSGILFPILQQLGLDKAVRFVRADYRWKTPWADFKVDSLAHVREAVTAAFPESRAEVRAYFRDLRRAVEVVRAFRRHPNPLLYTGLRRSLAFIRFLAESARSMTAVRSFADLSGLALAERHFTNPVLIDFFGRFGYTGSPAISTAGAWGSWIYDYWYPLGGLQSFADLLAQSYANHGGELRYRTRVAEILLEPGPRAAGVLTEAGEPLASRYVVAASDHRRLAQELLPAEALDPAWREEAGTAPVSDPLFSVYLGVDIPRAELAGLMQTHHVFVQPETVPLPPATHSDPDFHAHRWVEVSSPSLADPALAPPGQSSLILQSMSSYEWLDHWRTGPDGRRTPAYRELKARVADQLIHTAEAVIPGLSRRSVVRDAATPLTCERYTLNSRGATAGWTWNSRLNPVKSHAGRYRTPVENLLQAGHWTARIGGVSSAALSAKLVSNLIT